MLNLEKIRLEKGISVAELARRSGVSRPYICQLENHIYGNPSLKTILNLCKALEVTPNELIKEEYYAK